MKLNSCDGVKRGRIAAVAIRMIWFWALTIAATTAQAVIVTVDAFGPIYEITGSNPGRLVGVNLTSILNFTFSYQSDLALTSSSGNSFLYDAPKDSSLSTVQVGAIYGEFTNFQLNLYEGVQNTFNHRPQTVDMALLFAYPALVGDSPPPIDSMLAMLLYPEGSFQGGPVLPSMAPLITFLSFTDYGDTVNDSATAQALVIRMIPVPEPAIFGLMGALSLGFLAGVRRIRAQRAAIGDRLRPEARAV